jgi:hypothetical protein
MTRLQKIWEFSDPDLDMDLLDDMMGDMGLSQLGGYIFQWDSLTETPLVEIMIATSPRKALQIYADHGWFGPDLELAITQYGKKFRHFRDFFKHLEDGKTIFNAKIIEQLFVLPSEKSSGYGRVNALNPFAVTEFLKSKFENVESRYNFHFKQATLWTPT